MNPISWLDSQPWVRPSLMVLTGAAYLVQLLTPSYTVAHRIATAVLTGTVTLGVGSVGAKSAAGASK